MRNLEEIKADLAKAEKMLGIAVKQNAPEAVMKNAESKVEKYKNELQELEKSAEKKVEKAEDKAEEAKKEGDVAAEKKAKKEAKKAEKEATKAAEAVEKAEEKSEKIEKEKSKVKGRGGAGRGQGRKPSSIPKMPKEKKQRGGAGRGQGRKKKASAPTKITKPKNYVSSKNTPVFVKRKVVKKVDKIAAKKAVPVKVEKVKTVRAFGQTVEYKNDSEFCSQLIKAFKKRKAVSKKLGKKKTRPVFGIITTKIKDAVTKAIDNTPKKDIEANPKVFLAKAERLEKSAIRFLEDFKAILGSDFKKSEITAEFGDLEKSIKQMISKYKK